MECLGVLFLAKDAALHAVLGKGSVAAVLIALLHISITSAFSAPQAMFPIKYIEHQQPPETPPAVPWKENGPPSVAWRPELHRQGPLNSVYLSAGEFYQEELDLRIIGRGLDLIWARKYRSKSDQISAIGHGWTFSYDISIRKFGKGLRLRDGWGRNDFFR